MVVGVSNLLTAHLVYPRIRPQNELCSLLEVAWFVRFISRNVVEIVYVTVKRCVSVDNTVDPA